MPVRDAHERFWPKVAFSDGCWEWTAYRNPDGYGHFAVGAGRGVRAHRWGYEALRGPIPEGLILDHLCRNPPCVNPWHLEPVTYQVNTIRGVNIGRPRNSFKTICKRGHPLIGDNVRCWKNQRHCRLCSEIRSAARTRCATSGTSETHTKYLSTNEVAASLRVSSQTVRNWMHEGLFGSVHMFSHVLHVTRDGYERGVQQLPAERFPIGLLTPAGAQ